MSQARNHAFPVPAAPPPELLYAQVLALTEHLEELKGSVARARSHISRLEARVALLEGSQEEEAGEGEG
jgi:ParB-like chromosome segregation protein Spo0J